MNNNKAYIFLGSLVAVGLIVMGICVRSGIRDLKLLDRAVTVRGLSEIEVPANRAIWPISYTELGNELQDVYSSVESKNAKVIAFLMANGVTKDEISASAPVIVDQRADRYNNTPVVYRYSVTSTITVSSSKVDLVRELMVKQTSLLKEGIAITGGNWQFQTQFLYTALNDVKPSMIEEATKNARLSAEKFAADSQSSLGKIKTATQGQVTISDRDANTPYIKTLRVVTTVEYYLED